MNQGSRCSDSIVLVLDTTALLAKYPLQIYGWHVKMYTTPSVISEVRDKESRESTELALVLDKILVKQPSLHMKKKVVETIIKIGEHSSLSSTDVDVVALAFELKSRGGKVVVITDDYALQNTLLHLGIPFKPLRTRGIRSSRTYIVYCPSCGYTSTNLGEKQCPICGSLLKKKVVKKSS